VKSDESPGLRQAREASRRAKSARTEQEELGPVVTRAVERQRWHQDRNHFADAVAAALSVRHGEGRHS
jgi:inorganic triphosphatase YgiF